MKKKAKPKAKAKPKLPRGSMPPPERTHRDEKKEQDRTACRRFKKGKREQ